MGGLFSFWRRPAEAPEPQQQQQPQESDQGWGFGNLLDDALDTAEDAVDFVSDVGSDALETGGAVLDWAGDRVDEVVEGGREVVDWAVDEGRELVEEGGERIAPIVEAGSDAIDWAIEEGSERIAPLIDLGEDAVDWAMEEGADLVGPALDLGEDVLRWAVEQGEAIGQGASDLMRDGGALLEDIGEVFGLDTENAGSLEEVLSDEQAAFLRELYGDSLDLSQIRYTRDGLTPQIAGAPNTVGNTLHLVSQWGPQIFDEDGQITPEGMELVIHELGHAWQYQNGGWDYMPEAIWANAYHTVVDGDRNQAYEYDPSMDWAEMNPEQQAHAIEDAGVLMWRQAQGEVLTPEELQELESLRPYLDEVRAGRGA